MTVYPDGRLEGTPDEIVRYSQLCIAVQQQAQQSQAAAGSVTAISGVTPALRHEIAQAIIRYQRSMYSY